MSNISSGTASPEFLYPANYDKPTLGFWELVFFVGMLAAGFFLVDHSPMASSYYEATYNYSSAVNRTADRVERVNFVSAPMRVLLGMVGIGCLVFAPKQNLRWGGMILFTFLMYLGFLGTSVLWSINPSITIQKFAVMCMMAAAAYGMSRRLSLHDLAIVFTLVCLFYIAIGLAAEIALGNFKPHQSEYRFIGTCHPNSLAAYASFCCLAAPLFTKPGKRLNLLSISLIVLGVVVLLATKSRTTLAGLVFAVLATRMITFKPNQRALGISAVLLGFVAVAMALSLSRASTWSATSSTVAMGRTEDVSSLTGRLPLWEELIDSIEKHPTLGHGYLAYWEKEQIERLADILHWEIPHGHNMYLDVMIDGGAVGLFLFVLFHIVTLATAFGRYLRWRDPGVAFVFGVVVFALVHGFAESLFKLPTFLTFVLLTSALRLGARRPYADSSDETTEPTPTIPATELVEADEQ